jgi:hypothetical protein
MLALQRTAGNRAVRRMLAAQGIPARPTVARRASRVTLQRDPLDENVCNDPDFCKPYATNAEAAAAETWLRTNFLPAMEVKFGKEVRDLWQRFLDRKPGDSLDPVVFETAGNPIEKSFAVSGATTNDADDLLRLVIDNLNLIPGGTLQPDETRVVSLANIFGESSILKNRPIDYSNTLRKSGSIAGGLGKSAAGKDYREILRGDVTMTKRQLIGNRGYIDFTLSVDYEVFDALDFCPGACGALLEQQFTIPLSRLEAHGEAYDVPYIVRFSPEPRTNREWYKSFPI